jgi:2-polyprenyl-6-methoxyphenol hydroxylase-like FAD-dependent oxidoreductase
VEQRDVIVIGAGPSGAIASALLNKRGWSVLVLEGQRFPRFAIGESLLPHCLDFVAEAGMLPAVEQGGFQYKNGAAFIQSDKYADFDFGAKFTPGFDSAFQVYRASSRFDMKPA